jgi:hypothetical protein
MTLCIPCLYASCCGAYCQIRHHEYLVLMWSLHGSLSSPTQAVPPKSSLGKAYTLPESLFLGNERWRCSANKLLAVEALPYAVMGQCGKGERLGIHSALHVCAFGSCATGSSWISGRYEVTCNGCSSSSANIASSVVAFPHTHQSLQFYEKNASKQAH